MAGSSMDGLDLSHVVFSIEPKGWNYQLKKCETIFYDKGIFSRLKNAHRLDRDEQESIDVEFGNWIGEKVSRFKNDIEQIDLAGIHGHTLIHKPEDEISWQLGRGDIIAKIIKLPTVTEFRTEDVKNSGQGAPLVPFGDFTLFEGYDACLNLGGIANISLKESQTAWDICPCNQVLNYFSNKLGKSFDQGGELAEKGQMNLAFYSAISKIDFFHQSPPKSLPNHFINQSLLDPVDPTDGLYTYCQIIAEQINQSLEDPSPGKLLVTGGGAFNEFLISKIESELKGWEVIIPDSKLIDFKESLIFAFLALKRFRNEVNVLASVTGAAKDSSSGVIHLP